MNEKDLRLYLAYLECELDEQTQVLDWAELLLLFSPSAVKTGIGQFKDEYKPIQDD